MSKKLALKWHDSQSNWSNSLSSLRNDTEFADVTLISEDKVKFSAHKVLLASCSSMFKFILEGHNNSIPLLYFGGVSSEDLGFILDYIYFGEINIFQEQLDSFLETAKKLDINGLMKSMRMRQIMKNTLIRKSQSRTMNQKSLKHWMMMHLLSLLRDNTKKSMMPQKLMFHI